MKQNEFVKTKLVIIFCLLVFGATDFGKLPSNAEELQQKQMGGWRTSISGAQAESEKGLTNTIQNSAQKSSVTGTYLYKNEGNVNRIRILQTSANKIKVSFEGIYQYKIPGRHLNTRGDGIPPQIIRFEKGKAILFSEDATECRTSLTFLRRGVLKAVQSEEGCFFPDGVSANGIYRKISSKEPRFED